MQTDSKLSASETCSASEIPIPTVVPLQTRHHARQTRRHARRGSPGLADTHVRVAPVTEVGMVWCMQTVRDSPTRLRDSPTRAGGLQGTPRARSTSRGDGRLSTRLAPPGRGKTCGTWSVAPEHWCARPPQVRSGFAQLSSRVIAGGEHGSLRSARSSNSTPPAFRPKLPSPSPSPPSRPRSSLGSPRSPQSPRRNRGHVSARPIWRGGTPHGRWGFTTHRDDSRMIQWDAALR